MKPDTSRWRDPSQYEFYDALPVEGTAWECLRRNTTYQASFDSLIDQEVEHLPLSEEDQRRWGLRFPCRPQSFRARPTGYLVAACQSSRADAWHHPRLSLPFVGRVIRRSC